MCPTNPFSRFVRLLLLCVLLLVHAVPAAAEVESGAPAPYSQEDQPVAPAPVPAQDPAAAALQAELDAFEAVHELGPEAFLERYESASPEAQELLRIGAEAARRTLGLLPAETPSDDAQVEAVNRVGINGAACAYTSISAALAAANPGDTLCAAVATYNESVVINKDITIVGGYNASCTAPLAGQISTIDGVTNTVQVSGSTAILRNLKLTGGSAAFGGGLGALGTARVTLDNTDIYSNTANYGGGVYIATPAAVTATNGSLISSNQATISGGGLRVWGRFAALDNESDINLNKAPDGGGISVPGGVVYLNNADVFQNQATAAQGRGGGVHLTYDGGARGVLTATNYSYIYYLNTAYDGAGIYADSSDVYLLTGVYLRDNTASNYGGAIYLANGSVLDAGPLASIGQAGAGLENQAIYGGGIYAVSSTVRLQGKIVNNEASVNGGGLYALSSVVELTDAVVGSTDANTANKIGSGGLNGAGLYLTNTHASLVNTAVISNVLTNPNTGYGAGIYIRNGSVVTLTNSRVELNTAPSTLDAGGAGIYVYGSTLLLDNSDILTNTSGLRAGGIRLWDSSTLTVTNNSLLQGNQALNGGGGAIAMESGSLAFMDSTLRSNSAGTHGGAVYANGGTLAFTGGWTLCFNTAGGNGGALAVAGTADADLFAESYSLVCKNSASGNGGAVYQSNTDMVQLHATSGSMMCIYANSAQLNGGALAADGGGYFDIYGQVSFNWNWAVTGNGGGIYLVNDSCARLDDYTNLRPAMWDNAAAGSGGAVYAVGSSNVVLDGAIIGKPGKGNLALGSGSGGGLYLMGSTLNAENTTWQDNQAALHGGAIAAYTSTVTLRANQTAPLGALAEGELRSEAGINATPCDPLLGYCSALIGNIADSDGNNSGDGGALYALDSTLTVSQTHLLYNHAYRGGAVYQDGSAAVGRISNSLVAGNRVNLAFGAGIRQNAGSMTLQHVTIADNIGGAGFSLGGGGTSIINNSIAWGNTQGGFWGATPGSGSCNIDQSSGIGLNIDPLLTGAEWQLGSGSPALNACGSGLATDLLGRARPLGAAYDMGAYEGTGYAVRLPLTLRN